MVLLVSQFILAVSLGGVVLMLVRKMPVLLELKETYSQAKPSRRIREKFFPFLKTSTFSFRQRVRQLKQIKKIDLDDDQGQIQQVEQDSNYWTNIRQG